MTLNGKCRQAGVSYDSVRWYKRSTGCSCEEAIQHYLDKRNKPREMTFKEKCRIAGVNYGSAYAYKTNKKCTDEEAIQHYLECKK